MTEHEQRIKSREVVFLASIRRIFENLETATSALMNRAIHILPLEGKSIEVKSNHGRGKHNPMYHHLHRKEIHT